MLSRQWLHELGERCARGSFWGRLKESERSAFADIADEMRYERGSRLIPSDDPAGSVAVLCRGRVRVVEGTGRRLLAVRGPGDIVGEQVVFERHRRPATVVADSQVRAALVGMREFERLVGDMPQFLRVLGEVISERLREATLGGTSRNDSLSKVVRYLQNEVENQLASVVADVRVHIKSQRQLAALLGVSRESVVRALRRLRESGLVTTRNGVVVVADPAGLRTWENRDR